MGIFSTSFYPFKSEMLLIALGRVLVQMVSIILWVTLVLGVTYNTCGVYLYDSLDKHTIQRPCKPSVFSCYFVTTSFSWNSVHSVMRLLTLIF